MRKAKIFEAMANFDAASIMANLLAEEFAKVSGKELHRIDHPEIDSPMYGWTDLKYGLPEDDRDACYVIVYEVDASESVYIYPSSKKIVVWRSITPQSDDEGALNPTTGEYYWEDDMHEAAYSLKTWEKYFSKNS